jgi:conjugal transfer pilus assembly protein TraB
MMNFWHELEPDKKRNLVVVGLVAAIVFIFWVFSASSNTDSKQSEDNKQQSITRVLSNRDTREFGVQELQSIVKRLERDKKEMERKQERLNNDIADLKKRKGEESVLTNQVGNVESSLATMKEEFQVLKEKNQDLQREVAEATMKASRAIERVGTGSGKKAGSDSNAGEAESELDNYEVSTGLIENPNDYFAAAPLPAQEGRDAKGNSKSRNIDGAEVNTIRVIGGLLPSDADQVEEEAEGIYIPAGSMVTGVLINGLDAPTSSEATRNPFPATIRIQHEALLPNYYTADIRECFLIISGHGDMSSERAYLRGEDISCIDGEGQVIESPIKGYATGEDGKAGIRGRLVSKSGQVLARAMQAGFLDGLAGALDYSPVPVIQTDSIGSSPTFQQALSKETFTNGVLGWSSQALEKIADYYLDMAKNIFPVIEIDAGREVTFILTKGVQMKPKKRSIVAKVQS